MSTWKYLTSLQILISVCCSVEAPIIYQPDPDFESFDGRAQSESWLEIPLKADRQLPMTCCVSLCPSAR